MTGFLSPEDSPAAATLPAGTPGWLAGGLGQPGAETSASPLPAGDADPDGTLVELGEQAPAWPAPDTDTPPSVRGTSPRAGRGENTGPSSPPGGGPAPGPSGADAVRYTAVPDGPTWTIELPAGLALLSLNGREHHMARNRTYQSLKKAAWAMARNARLPGLGRAEITVEYQPPDRRRRDAENVCAASGKACIDGIVAAGVLPDDECPRYVTRIVYTIGPVYPRGRLLLHVREVSA